MAKTLSDIEQAVLSRYSSGARAREEALLEAIEVTTAPESEVVEIDSALEERLEALGYEE